MKNISKPKITFIWIVLITTCFGLLPAYIYYINRCKNISHQTLEHDNDSSQNECSTNSVNKNILVEKILPILNNYQSYLIRKIDDNEFESLMNSLKSHDTIDEKIRGLENSIIIAKSISAHELTGLMTSDNPIALIDGKTHTVGDKLADSTIVNITAYYVTLQKENIQYNLRISKNLHPSTNPPRSYLAWNSSSHNTKQITNNDYRSYSLKHVLDYSSAFNPDLDSDNTINLCDKNSSMKYLGQLGGNKFNPSSTRNPFGAGNHFHPDSIKNQFGKYGSKFSPNSIRNPFAIDTPKLYDSQGNYRGKLSSNPYDPDSISNPYGRYGNPFSTDSINNSFGAGNPFSPDSPRNPFGKGLAIYGND